MSVRIPLRYSGVEFSNALVDDDAERLLELGYYSVTLPKSLRRIAGKRPDVILAFLQEDPLTVQRCRPFISVYKTQVMLVQLVLRTELANVVLSSYLGTPVSIQAKINEIRRTIGRIVYADGNSTNCQLSNIREL